MADASHSGTLFCIACSTPEPLSAHAAGIASRIVDYR